MLDIRPNCEICNKDLPPDSTCARICSYECTYCVDCVEGILQNVCPNCGGGFVARPIRPAREYRAGVSLRQQPASTKRVHGKYGRDELASFVAEVKDIEPERR
jgi:hypothetical protein